MLSNYKIRWIHAVGLLLALATIKTTPMTRTMTQLRVIDTEIPEAYTTTTPITFHIPTAEVTSNTYIATSAQVATITRNHVHQENELTHVSKKINTHVRLKNSGAKKIFLHRSALLISPSGNGYNNFRWIIESFEQTHNIIYYNMEDYGDGHAYVRDAFIDARKEYFANGKPSLIVLDNIDASIERDIEIWQRVGKYRESLPRILENIKKQYDDSTNNPRDQFITIVAIFNNRIYSSKHYERCFNYLLDEKTALRWQRENEEWNHLMAKFIVGAAVVSVICGIEGWRKYKKQQPYQKIQQPLLQQTSQSYA